MTEPPTVPDPPPAHTSPPPLEPKPTTLLAALIVAGVLVYNISVDGDSYVTYGLVIGLCGVLGFDLSRFWPWGRGEK